MKYIVILGLFVAFIVWSKIKGKQHAEECKKLINRYSPFSSRFVPQNKYESLTSYIFTQVIATCENSEVVSSHIEDIYIILYASYAAFIHKVLDIDNFQDMMRRSLKVFLTHIHISPAMIQKYTEDYDRVFALSYNDLPDGIVDNCRIGEFCSQLAESIFDFWSYSFSQNLSNSMQEALDFAGTLELTK